MSMVPDFSRLAVWLICRVLSLSSLVVERACSLCDLVLIYYLFWFLWSSFWFLGARHLEEPPGGVGSPSSSIGEFGHERIGSRGCALSPCFAF